MTTKVYYAENCNELTEALQILEVIYGVSIERNFIEMNYSEIIVRCSEPTLKVVETLLAPLV